MNAFFGHQSLRPGKVAGVKLVEKRLNDGFVVGHDRSRIDWRPS
jgi:hypothetical protein